MRAEEKKRKEQTEELVCPNCNSKMIDYTSKKKNSSRIGGEIKCSRCSFRIYL